MQSATPQHHPDAYRLITYRSDDAATKELVWNSRDRAAPLTILLRDERTARRVKTHEPYLPTHVPAVGHLVLLDCTPEWAQERAHCLATQLWDQGTREGCESVVELETALYGMFERDVESQYGIAVEVTPELAAARGWFATA